MNLNLFPLSYWQMRGDLLQALLIVKGLDCCLVFSEFFEFAATTHLRDHPSRLRVQQARLDVHKFSFSVRVVKPRNALPEDVVISPSLKSFKTKERSTLDAVALVVHLALRYLDKCCRAYACEFLDYSSAFNTIPRPLLLNNTSASGSPGWVVSWLEDYFTSRTQFVQSGKRKSTVLPNNCGVIQGAILSPHLYSLHTDDLRSPNDFMYIKYADDMVVGHPLKNQTHLQCLKDGLDHVAAWSSDNGLQLNHEKSVQCGFHLRPSPSSQFSAVLPNEVSFFRYLCVTLTSNLSFSQYIDAHFTKIRKLLYYIGRLRSYHTPQALIWRYKEACVLPLILLALP
ncbi:unnamed protein product [Schistocephalus solidus]|uniref:Reverse transcriptase domain-containing protein n=1 Tax=Schistocephalus solidus TaxID=70667 RepID=A0A183TRN5_SCHSO|nr:unnamed protein product [Schistocephalus solidus]